MAKMVLRRCVMCGLNSPPRATKTEVRRDVTGHAFVATVPATKCSACKEEYLDASVLEAFELGISRELARAGVSSGEALRFMRKTMGLRAIDLAPLLGVTPETVSRWETDRRSIDRNSMALLGLMLEDACLGATGTVDRLRAIDKPARMSKRITRIEVAAARERRRSAS